MSAGEDCETRLHVVAAERDDQEVERGVAAQAGREIVGAAAIRLDRVVEHRRAAVEPFLDHAMAGAQFPPHDAGPAYIGRKPRRGRGIIAPGVGIAECDDDRHGIPLALDRSIPWAACLRGRGWRVNLWRAKPRRLGPAECGRGRPQWPRFQSGFSTFQCVAGRKISLPLFSERRVRRWRRGRLRDETRGFGRTARRRRRSRFFPRFSIYFNALQAGKFPLPWNNEIFLGTPEPPHLL